MTPDLAALQALWRQRDQVVLLQAGFGTGEAFLGIWHAWRHDAQRSARLHVITIESTPPETATSTLECGGSNFSRWTIPSIRSGRLLTGEL